MRTDCLNNILDEKEEADKVSSNISKDETIEDTILNEDDLPDVLPDEPIEVSTEVEEQPTKEEKDSVLTGLINSLIVNEFEYIQHLNDSISTITAINEQEYSLSVLKSILDEENIHVGQLQELLKDVSPSAEKIDDGKEETKEEK